MILARQAVKEECRKGAEGARLRIARVLDQRSLRLSH